MFKQFATTLLVIDPTVDHYQSLLVGLSADVATLILQADQDGIEQITTALAHFGSLRSVHILSHGDRGMVRLGSTLLTVDTLSHYQAQLQAWKTALTPAVDILFYGCSIAAGAEGQQLVQQISEWTGANVAASSDVTGNADLGGNWELEVTVGNVTSEMVFHAEAIAAYVGVLPVPLMQESFTGSDVNDNTAWLFGTGTATSANPFLTARSSTDPSAPNGLPGGGSDASGDGALRLTNATDNQATFVIFNQELNAAGGLSITFDLFAYGGTDSDPNNRADGISFFLIDGNASPTQAGGFGGSLGYAQRTDPNPDISGIEGGYLGIGFDVFGNFSAPLNQSWDSGRIGGPGQVRDSVAVRGQGSGIDGYEYLTGNVLPFSLDNAASGATREDSLRRVTVELTPEGNLTVIVRADLNKDSDFDDANETATPISNFNVTAPAANNAPLPSTFKFGFAGSTGSFNNIHEIRNLAITSVVPSASLILSNSPFSENGGVATITAQLSEVTSQDVTIHLELTGTAIASTDYTASATSILIPAGQLTGSITLTGLNDTLLEGNESVVVDITSVTNAFEEGVQRVTAQITDVLPSVTLSLSNSPFAENGGVATVTAQLSAVTSEDVTVNLGLTGTAIASMDYTASAAAIVIPAGELTGTLTLTGINDSAIEGNESVIVDITSVVNATEDGVQQVSAAIQDDDRAIAEPTPQPGTPLQQRDNPAPRCKPGIVRRGNGNDNDLKGTADRDRLMGNAGNDTLWGNRCGDWLYGSRGRDTLHGGHGFDFLKGGADGDRLLGGLHHDRLVGNQGEDELRGGLGNDILRGGNHRDKLWGGQGSDRLGGGSGSDRLYGEQGDDFLFGHVGEDWMDGGAGSDRMRGGLSADVMFGRAGHDQMFGGAGSDRLYGNAGNDFLHGRLHGDLLYGGDGNDTLHGGAGRDQLVGEDGHDLLIGGIGDDQLTGGNGKDVLIGGWGADVISVGQGRDRIVYQSASDGGDRIQGFNVSQDVIDLSQIMQGSRYTRANKFRHYVQLTRSGAGAVLSVDFNGDAAGGFKQLAVLNQVSANRLTASNFAFSPIFS